LQVEHFPERDQLVPRCVLVAANADPLLLRVAGEHEIVLQLPAHEALVVVRRGVDKMADDLARRPLARRRPRRARVTEREQSGHRLIHRLSQFVNVVH
jgi:hypothetical protein